MTNYKRFVSYFYQYESGKKNSNTGYARIETSDEVCKVSLNCNLKTIAGRVGRVYFVKKYHDQTEGILVGTATTKEDGLEARVTMPKGAIENAKVRFYEITGIVVCFSKENYFVTEWDGVPITYRQVTSFEEKYAGTGVLEKEEKKKEPKVVEVVDTRSQKGIEVVAVQKEKEEMTKEEEAKSTVSEMASEDRNNKASKEMVSIDKEENNATEEQSGESTLEAKEEQKDNDDRVKESKESTLFDKMEATSKEEWKAAGIEEEFDVSLIEATDSSEQTQECLKEEEEEEVLDDNDTVVSAANCMTTPSVSEKEGWCDHPSARAILDRFPHMYPFDDGEITECVRIEPKDLGLLPIDAWILGNNSFLLHAFCTYRHLLFAKKMTREGIYYMVMVPGAYNAREKHMASMFGFREFKCSRRRKMRDGEFGYWYLYVDYSSTSTC